MMNMMNMAIVLVMMRMMKMITIDHLAPTLASYSSSLMSLARPKSAIFTMLLSPTRTFLAARSLQARGQQSFQFAPYFRGLPPNRGLLG